MPRNTPRENIAIQHLKVKGWKIYPMRTLIKLIGLAMLI